MNGFNPPWWTCPKVCATLQDAPCQLTGPVQRSAVLPIHAVLVGSMLQGGHRAFGRALANGCAPLTPTRPPALCHPLVSTSQTLHPREGMWPSISMYPGDPVVHSRVAGLEDTWVLSPDLPDFGASPLTPSSQWDPSLPCQHFSGKRLRAGPFSRWVCTAPGTLDSWGQGSSSLLIPSPATDSGHHDPSLFPSLEKGVNYPLHLGLGSLISRVAPGLEAPHGTDRAVEQDPSPPPPANLFCLVAPAPHR